jgi:hypothetical protein
LENTWYTDVIPGKWEMFTCSSETTLYMQGNGYLRLDGKDALYLCFNIWVSFLDDNSLPSLVLDNWDLLKL